MHHQYALEIKVKILLCEKKKHFKILHQMTFELDEPVLKW